jgi:hypothetical protein
MNNDKQGQSKILTCFEEYYGAKMMIMKKQKLGIAEVAENGSLKVGKSLINEVKTSKIPPFSIYRQIPNGYNHTNQCDA